MSSNFFSTVTEVFMIDTRNNSGFVILPAASTIQGRLIRIKDTYGTALKSTITIQTTGVDLFENGLSTMILKNNFDNIALIAGAQTTWHTFGGTTMPSATINSSMVSSLLVGFPSDSLTANTALDVRGQTTMNLVPDKGIWVAGGQPGTSTIYTSTDTITWIVRTCPITGFVYGLAYNGIIWIAVGTTGSTIATSLDGITWNSVVNTLTTGRAIAWNGSIWVAAGIASTGTSSILSSTDGLIWSGQNAFLSTCYSVAWNGMLWVAVGSLTQGTTTNTIVTSTDGIIWINRPNGFTTAGYCVAWNGSLWIAGGTSITGGPFLQTSLDGISWIPRTVAFTGSVNSIAWNGSIWLAGGSGTVTLQRSSDGIMWTTCANNITGTIHTISWNGSIWFAGGVTGQTGQSSPDGITWTSRPTNLTVTYAVAYTSYIIPTTNIGNLSIYTYGQPNFLSTLNQCTIFTSSIAINNTLYVNKTTRVGINTGNPQATLDVNGQLYSYEHNIGAAPTPAVWIAGGSNSSGITITTSLNGIDWYSRPNSISGIVYGIAWNGSYFMAVGTTSKSLPIIQTSSNGYSWTTVSALTGFVGPIYCVATNGSIWIVGGDLYTYGTTTLFAGQVNTGATIQTSTDSITWTTRASTLLQVNALTWNGYLWVALGSGNGYTIQTSPNGITWTATLSGFTVSGQGIAWNGYLWVSVGISNGLAGSCCIQTSPDGINWTSRISILTQAYCVGWNGSTWTVGGEGTPSRFVSSPDGITWTAVGNGIAPTTIYSIAWNGSIWVATGPNGSIYASIDGITWTSRANPLTTTRAICYPTYNTPTIGMSNLNIYSQGQPTYLTSTNQITSFSSTITLNNTLTVSQINRVGINIGNPLYTLDVNGYANFAGIRTNVNGTPNLYVAVGSNLSGSITVQTSTDAITWYSRNTNYSIGKTNAIGWNGTMLIALSSEGGANIQISYDGLAWTTITGNYSNGLYGNCIGWSGSLWVSGGTGGMILTSPNGITWTSRTNGFTVNGIIYGLAWSGNQWVAVGTQYSQSTLSFIGFIQISPDGITWTTCSTHPFSTSVNGVAWNGGYYVAVGRGGGTIARSKDGIIWIASVNPFTVGTSIGWNGSIWAAGGSNSANVITSSDGINWRANAISINNVNTIIWAGNQWIAGGSGGQTINTSPDGITWTLRTSLFGSTTGACLGLIYMSPILPNIDMSSIMIYSYNSPNYLSNINTIVGVPSTLTLNNTLYVKQQNLVGINTGNPQATLDVNGPTRTLGLTTNMLALSNWVAVGSDLGGTIGIIQSSSNGTIWSSNTNAFTTTVNCIAWNDSYFLAGGQGTNTMQISYDGIGWSNIITGFGTSTGAVYGIGWNSQTWVAVGSSNGPVAPFIQTSSNGTTWTTQTSAFTTAGRCVGWNGYEWLVGGQGTQTIQTSSNSTTWVSKTNNITGACFGTAWNGQVWVTVGSNSAAAIIQTSSNSISWTNQIHAFTTSVNAVTWNGFLFVAVGQGTVTLQTSPDGITWTTRINNFVTSGNSIAWNGNIWIAGGSGGILQTSPDGITWTSQTNNVSIIRGIAYTNFLTPNIASSNLNVYSHGQTNFLRSTNQIMAYTSTIALNNTLYVGQDSIVGITGTLGVTGLATLGTLGVTGTTTLSGDLTTSGATTLASGTTVFYYTLNFTARDSVRTWQSVASSGDGTKLVALVDGGNIWTSTDSGVTWTERFTGGPRNWISVASSADGTKLVAVVYVGIIYTSTDSGASWTPRDPPTSRYWSSVASSSDGTKLAAATGNTNIWTSTDSGGTWTERFVTGNSSWNSIASSSDGTKLAALVTGGNIWTSINSGVNWTERVVSTIRNWRAIASSSDGTKLVAVGSAMNIWTSIDSGVNWRPRATSLAWRAVASSADGTKLVAVIQGGTIWTSTDSGVTWTERLTGGSRNWYGVASSYDGTQVVVAVNVGQLWTIAYSGKVGIGTTTPSYTLDVNGPAQSAIYYSSITATTTTTVTPTNFGIFYNITSVGPFTFAFSATQALSNIGKYTCIRNNSGATLSIILTNASGITSPITLFTAQSATIVVATSNTYALF